MNATIRTVDVSDYAEFERPDMTRPYEVVSSPAGETIRAYFTTEDEARAEVATIEALTGTYMTSWGEQPLNTDAHINHYVDNGYPEGDEVMYSVYTLADGIADDYDVPNDIEEAFIVFRKACDDAKAQSVNGVEVTAHLYDPVFGNMIAEQVFNYGERIN